MTKLYKLHKLHEIDKEKIKPLIRLQESFKNFIESEIETKKRKNKHKNNFFFNSISPLKNIDLNLAQKIYKENYFETLKTTLKSTFPACFNFLKEKVFHKLSFHFALSYPPKSPFLFEYGKEFPSFLKHTFFKKSFPFLDSLAHFEWLFKELTLMKSFEKPSSLKRIKTILEKNSDDEIQFQLLRSVSLYSSKFLIYDLWRELMPLNPLKNLKSKNSALKSKKTKNKPMIKMKEKKQERTKNILMIKEKSHDLEKKDFITIQNVNSKAFFLASSLAQNPLSLLNLKRAFTHKFKNKKKDKNHLKVSFTESLSHLIQIKALKIKLQKLK